MLYSDHNGMEQRRMGLVAGDRVFLLPEDLKTMGTYRAPRFLEEKIVEAAGDLGKKTKKTSTKKGASSGRAKGKAARGKGADQI